MTTTTSSRTAALAVGATILLAGCGGGGDTSSSASRQTATSAAPSGASTPTTTTASSGASPAAAPGDTVPLKVLSDRVLAAMEQDKTFAATMKSTNGTVTGSFQVTEPVGYRLTMGSGSSAMSAIKTGSTMYLKAGALGSSKWMKISAGSTRPEVRALAAGFDTSGKTLQPGVLLSAAPEAKASVVSAADGATTYRAALTQAETDKVAAAVGAAAGAGGQGSAGKVAPMTITYVMEDSGRLRSVDTLTGGKHTLITYSDWGKPVDLAAPPAAEVQTL